MPLLPKISPLGDCAVTVDFGNEISPELNDRAVALASYFEAHPFPGYIEAAPAYSSVGVFYNLSEVRRTFPEFESAFEAVRDVIHDAFEVAAATAVTESRVIEIPTNFGVGAALDLDVIAAHSGLSHADVIELFISKIYRVYMLGFLPGFTYMGEVDDRIAIPRKDAPRKVVPKGSVGIAGTQTGIYPLESPGGWQIIGRTDSEMFAPNSSASPCLLKPGDEVRFVPAK